MLYTKLQVNLVDQSCINGELKVLSQTPFGLAQMFATRSKRAMGPPQRDPAT